MSDNQMWTIWCGPAIQDSGHPTGEVHTPVHTHTPRLKVLKYFGKSSLFGGQHSVILLVPVLARPLCLACSLQIENTFTLTIHTYHPPTSHPPRLTPSIGATETLPGKSCKQIRDVLANDCTKVTQSGLYWVNVTSVGDGYRCQEGEESEVMKVRTHETSLQSNIGLCVCCARVHVFVNVFVNVCMYVINM